ncbi:M20/M25/M40 family metallo-hydrolase [Mesobacillus foraminis]|uniref:M20 family metallopeptidase n=1 Tax=Mesobacillus foraminis TaxID=279826 RepID=UPI0039A203BB
MEDVKTLLREMLLIDSSHIDGANHTVDFCRQWLKEHGLQTLELENNGYKMLLCEIGSGEKTIVFNGHVDVVSGKKDQFIPREKDGLLFGRGAADMKAGVAAMMCALAELKDEPLGVKIQLQIVSDEEVGGYNCTGYLVENGYTGDFVICSEPTQLGIALQAKGVLHLDIDIKGKPAHGSRPWEGENAIIKACRLHKQILKLPFMSESSEFYPYPSVNWAKIKGGDVYNKVPESCTISFDIRYLPGQDADTITSQIQSITDGEITVKVAGPPVETKENDEFVKKLSPIVEQHTKHPVEYFGQHGAADTHFFASKGIPAIEFGPSGANWHGNEEYVVISSLNTYKNMLVDYARKW